MKRIITLCIISLLLTTSYAAAEKVENEYAVGVGDVLSVNVLQPEELMLTVTVAPDGTISYPYIGTVNVKGRGLSIVQEEVQTRLADGYMKYPVVSVSLIESRSRKFFVYGEVIKPGTYFLEENVTVLKAISMAGGFTKFGSSSKVKLLRQRKDGPGYETMSVNMKSVMSGYSDEDLILEPGDIVVISEGMF